MVEYIRREDAIIAVTTAKLPDCTPNGVPIANGKRSVTDCIRKIKAIPAVAVNPARQGRWIPYNERQCLYVCSECNAFPRDQTRYCPNCGALMEKEAKPKMDSNDIRNMTNEELEDFMTQIMYDALKEEVTE